MAAFQSKMQRRRRELGISYPDLAALSGVSEATVKRIIHGQIESASMKHVAAVAVAMGLSLDMREDCSAMDVKEKAAERQANRLLRMVLGTSALEAQPVSDKQAETMKRDAVHKLMSGSSRRLWAS